MKDERNHIADSLAYATRYSKRECIAKQKIRWGILFRPGSLWVGVHWSRDNRRFCINLIPCVTLWITLKGGNVPVNYGKL